MFTRRFRTTHGHGILRVLAALLAVLMQAQLIPAPVYAAVAQTTAHAVRARLSRIAAERRHEAVLASLRANIHANLVAGSRASAQRVYTPRVATLLDEVGWLARVVPPAQVVDWSAQAACLPNNLSPQLPDANATAQALVSLGEYKLGREHQPRAAVLLFQDAERLTPRANATHGLAAYDVAMALFHEGAYAEAQHAFRAVLVAHPVFRGFDRRNAAMMMRHAMACAGYHEQHTRIGIPEPPRLDPECGAAAIATSLRAMHLPYDRATVLRSCRVTGEGSSLQDLVNAGKPLHVSIRMVGADAQGLMELPKPVIAFVEQDHFVSVVKTDGTGVSYLCSDCGAWPGGLVHLSWMQWHTMNPGVYAAVVKIGSPWDVRLATLAAPTRPDESQQVRVASAGSLVGLIGGKTTGSGHHLTPLFQTGSGIVCGNKPPSNQCPCPICCFMDGGGSGNNSGSSGGEPVNLATGEEEYTPATDLTVYNPIGPSVHWSRIYNSLRSPDQAWYEFQDFGAGWSQTYNMGVFYQPAMGSQAAGYFLYQSNGGRIPFMPSGTPTASNPSFACPFSPTGVPMIVTFNYAAGGNYFTIELPDRTTLTTLPVQVLNTSASVYPLTKITDRNGNWISLVYSTPLAENTPTGTSPTIISWPLLTAILDKNNDPLLSINRAANGSGNITSVDDAYGRSIYYNCGYYLNGSVPSGYPQFFQQLDHVSQIVPTGTATAPSDRYSYEYQQIANKDGSETVGFLHEIDVPNPDTSPGAPPSTSYINYAVDGTCLVTSIEDANGNTHTYATVANNPNATSVTVQDKGQQNTLASRIVTYDMNMSGTSQTDNNGQITSQSYYNDPNDPYKPSEVLDGNGNAALQQLTTGGNSSLPELSANEAAPISATSYSTYTGNVNDQYKVTFTITGPSTYGSNPIATANETIPSGGPGNSIQTDTLSAIDTKGSTWRFSFSSSAPVSDTPGTFIVTPPPVLTSLDKGSYQISVSCLDVINGGLTCGCNESASFVVVPAQGTVQYSYDAYGNVKQMISSRGVFTTNIYVYSNFALGELTQTQEGNKSPTTYSYYEPTGFVKTVTTPLPGTTGSTSTVTTTYAYDALGNVTSVVAPNANNASTTTTYNYTQGYGGSTASDRIGLPLTTTTSGIDSVGNTTTTVSYASYDNRGNALSMIDALGNETDTTYNLADQPVQTTYPVTGQGGSYQAHSLNTYQYVGGPLSKMQDFDESGSNTPYREMDYTYGPEGETSTVNGSTEPVAYTYDGLYRLKLLSDGNVNTTQYFYNASGYLAGVTYPGYSGSAWPSISGKDSVQFPAYDYDGNVLTRVDGNGTTANYTYNDLENQLTNIHYAPGSGVSLLADTNITYDIYGRRATVADAAVSKTEHYDDDDNLYYESTAFDGGQVLGYTNYNYNADGSCSSLGTQGLSFSYRYDGVGRMQSLTNPYNETSSWTYQQNNWLTSQTLGSGVTTSYAYNPRGFLADLKTTAPQASGGAVIAEFGGTVGSASAMTYDAVGNRTKLAGTLNAVGGFQMLGNGASSSQYAYNTANELTQEQTTEPGNGSYTNSYTYDAAQNRTTQTTAQGLATIPHNSDNQLSASPFYAYDGNGNPTTYTSPGNPVSGSANTNTFDPENRMTAYGVSGSSALLQCTYDSDGLRTSKTNSSGTTYYVYDQQDRPVVELNSSGAAAYVNTFGDNGLLSRRDVANSITTYYAFDPQGSAVDVMQNGNGLPAAYSAFGIPAAGSAGSSPWGFGAQWGYYTDAETGLILCTHRYYDPYTGRFVNRDPEGFSGGINLYNHVGNNPINYVDPSGFGGVPMTDGDLFVKYVLVPVTERLGLCGGFITFFMLVAEGTAGGPGDELPNPPPNPQDRYDCSEQAVDNWLNTQGVRRSSEFHNCLQALKKGCNQTCVDKDTGELFCRGVDDKGNFIPGEPLGFLEDCLNTKPTNHRNPGRQRRRGGGGHQDNWR